MWVRKAERPLFAVSVGLIIGGAIGNAIDRVRFGAVADFIDVRHLLYFPWIFNVADSAISIGICLLLVDMLRQDARGGRRGSRMRPNAPLAQTQDCAIHSTLPGRGWPLERFRFMSVNRVIVAAALLAATGLTGCVSTRNALGMEKVTPDEFRVVTKAPLVVPPDFALRPPAPGKPRPQELQPESAARTALLGAREGETRSDGEKLLVAKAGADKADPLIRYVVDDEFGDLSHKDRSFADRVMFWRADKTAPVPATANDGVAPIDPAAEADRISKLTGGKTVIIAREGDKKLKLPGL